MIMALQIAKMIQRAYDICDGTVAEKAVAGQQKYKSYFYGATKQRLYGKYEDAVDLILTERGYSNCIVACK